MRSASLLAECRRVRGTQDSRVHRKPWGVPVSVGRGRTQSTSIKTLLVRASSARIQGFSDIGESESHGALEHRDNLSGAPLAIPVNVFSGGGRE